MSSQELTYQTSKTKRGVSYEDVMYMFRYDEDTGKLYKQNSYHPKNDGKEAGRVEVSGKTKHYSRIVINIKGSKFMAHQVIWCMQTGCWLDDKRFVIDHIDGNAMNNRMDNLRVVTYAENSRNAGRLPSNKTGVAGVVWVEDRQRYRVRIRDWSGKKVSLGSFKTLEEAAVARKSAEAYYGYHENYGRELNGQRHNSEKS